MQSFYAQKFLRGIDNYNFISISEYAGTKGDKFGKISLGLIGLMFSHSRAMS